MTEEILNKYIKYKKDYGGWKVFNRTNEGVQFILPRTFSPILFWLGLLTCWIYGIGIVFWLIGAIGYFSSHEIIYIDIQQMKKELNTRGIRW